LQTKRACPICKSFNSKSMLTSELKAFDGSILPLNIQIAECMACGFVFNDDPIDEQALNQFYTIENYYYTEGSFGTGGSDFARYKNYVEFLKPFLQRADAIVDVGCGKGQFVKYLIDNGFVNASGVELDKRMVEIATKQGIPVHEGSAFGFSSYNDDSIDLMIYTNVFEHLLDPDSVIQQANQYLKTNGLLFIEVPNALNYSEARVFDFFWLATIEHINHFSNHYLELLLTRHGFELITKSEMTIPYNNPSYGYPSLKMLFRKKQTQKCMTGQPEYHEQLRNRICDHINMENEYLTKHRQMLQVLKDSKAKLYIWGIGREFFILSTFTELLNCNVQSLLDKNQDKHGRTVSGIRIVAPEQIQQAAADATVLLTSVFNQIQMQEYLREISFSGSVIIIT